MEIHFQIAEGPAYLAAFSFSREGDNILVEVIDSRGFRKAATPIDVVRFNQMTDMLLSDVPPGIEPPMQRDPNPPPHYTPATVTKDF